MTRPESDRPALLRVVAGVGAVVLGLAGAVLFALGGCHSRGGFCADSFSGTHVVLYGMGVVLLSSAAGLLARAATSRRAAVWGTAGGTALLLLALAVFVET